MSGKLRLEGEHPFCVSVKFYNNPSFSLKEIPLKPQLATT